MTEVIKTFLAKLRDVGTSRVITVDRNIIQLQGLKTGDFVEVQIAKVKGAESEVLKGDAEKSSEMGPLPSLVRGMAFLSSFFSSLNRGVQYATTVGVTTRWYQI